MKVISNATVSTGSGNGISEVNIIIEKGKIVDVVPASSSVKPECELIDATGFFVLPGGVDPHVHFNTPGYEHHEDFEHGSRAAAAGGVTTVIDMPDTCVPPVISFLNLEKKLKALEGRSFIDYALWGGVSGNSFKEIDWKDEMKRMWDVGVVGFKTYLLSGMDTFTALGIDELRDVLKHASSFQGLVALHAEDPEVVRAHEKKAKKGDSLQDYYFSRSDPAEEYAVRDAIGVLKESRSTLHIVHLASASAAKHISGAKKEKLNISAETCPQYLAFTHDDFEKIGASLKCAPVVKTKNDREALWRGLKDGTVDFVSTDHAPCTMQEKSSKNPWEIYNGMPGVQWRIPYLFSEGYLKDRISIARLVEIISTSAAKRFGLFPKKGTISAGSDADLVIIDPDRAWTVNGERGYSKGRLTPFEGQKFKCEVVATILRGEIVYSQEKFPMGSGYGRWVARG